MPPAQIFATFFCFCAEMWFSCTKMFHGEQKCVFLCRWHTKYVLHNKSRWGSGIFYAGCIQMCVLHKSRWGSASTTLFNIVTRQVHNCDLHENIQLRPACKYSTATCMKYFTSGAANIQLRPACKYSTATCMKYFTSGALFY